MAGPRDYTPTTRAALAALSRGTCYFPGCPRRVIILVEGEPYLDVEIAHIYDAHVGNRYDPTMSGDDRRAFSNLILLCKPHHNLVDKRHPERYRPEDLQAWKSSREGHEIVIDNPAALSEDALEESMLQGTIIHVEQGGLHLGGLGGSAIGAGGGGGGVIGSGTGGPGGPGSVVHLADEAAMDVDGASGNAPGAGGGGGGLLASGALVRRPQPDEGREGRGYSDGLDGQDGQPTRFGDPTSDVFVEALGGRGGLAGAGPRRASDALALSVVSLANSAELRSDLMFLLGGGWQNVEVVNIGDQLILLVVLVFEAGGLEKGNYTASVLVEDPTGLTAARLSLPVSVDETGDVVRIPRILRVAVEVTAFGVWRISAMNDAGAMGFVDLMVKRAGVRTAPSTHT